MPMFKAETLQRNSEVRTETAEYYYYVAPVSPCCYTPYPQIIHVAYTSLCGPPLGTARAPLSVPYPPPPSCSCRLHGRDQHLHAIQGHSGAQRGSDHYCVPSRLQRR